MLLIVRHLSFDHKFIVFRTFRHSYLNWSSRLNNCFNFLFSFFFYLINLLNLWSNFLSFTMVRFLPIRRFLPSLLRFFFLLLYGVLCIDIDWLLDWRWGLFNWWYRLFFKLCVNRTRVLVIFFFFLLVCLERRLCL